MQVILPNENEYNICCVCKFIFYNECVWDKTPNYYIKLYNYLILIIHLFCIICICYRMFILYNHMHRHPFGADI